jgi:hypothetical protein
MRAICNGYLLVEFHANRVNVVLDLQGRVDRSFSQRLAWRWFLGGLALCLAQSSKGGCIVDHWLMGQPPLARLRMLGVMKQR